jgi:hypothetical protein
MSLFVRAYPTNLNGTAQCVFNYGQDTTGYGAGILIDASNNWICLRDGVGSNTTSTAAVPNAWQDLLLVLDASGNVLMYVNGVLKLNSPGNTTNNVTVGGFSVGAQFSVAATPTFLRYFAGNVSQAAVWNLALSGTDATTLHNGAADVNTVQATNLQGYWWLCGNQSPEPDASSNNNALTLSGTASAADPPGIVTGCSTAFNNLSEAGAYFAAAGSDNWW